MKLKIKFKEKKIGKAEDKKKKIPRSYLISTELESGNKFQKCAFLVSFPNLRWLLWVISGHPEVSKSLKYKEEAHWL